MKNHISWRRVLGAGAALAFVTASQPAFAQTVGGPYEYSVCAVPEAVSIVREDENLPWWPPAWKTNRYVKMPGGSFTKMIPASGTQTAKNPEGVMLHGPGQITNCVPGSGGTQWVALRMKATGYFNTAVMNHIVVGARTSFPTFNSPNVAPYPNYQFMGVALSNFNGIFAERGVKPGNDEWGPSVSIPLVDGHTYLLQIHAGQYNMAYLLNDETTGASTGWQGFWPTQVPLTTTGLGLVVLCSDTNGACEAWNSKWRVDFFDIAAGWF